MAPAALLTGKATPRALDFEVTEKMLNYFIKAVHDRGFWAQPRVVVGIS